MRVRRFIFFSVLGTVLFCAGSNPLHAQLGFTPVINKPKPYEERVLKSEKTGDKPLSTPKKFLQNLTTHYNYYFNASNKLNEVIEKAKLSNKDNYSELLTFYNYSLDATARSKTELDSVIYKSQTGIVMHDLRNDWIDNMYMLWGAAYFFEKKFDSAALMFQFINYAFAEKEKDGYYKYIGSRMDGNNALSVSTREKKTSFPATLFSSQPSRNNAFLWLIRTQIENDDFDASGSLLATLKNDPVFPSRLSNELEEMEALWYYRQKVWDSAALHLSKALNGVSKKSDRARWEYLAAQLYDRSGKIKEAEDLYARAIAHTTDPVMDVYARLNLVRLNSNGGENYIDKNIAELLKMAKRDKYESYRDVIFYMAAQMELGRNNFDAAQALLLKAAKNNNGNLASSNNAYLQIADLSFSQKKYIASAAFYDSVKVQELEPEQVSRVTDRKAILAKIIKQTLVFNRQDSLQRIAAMPEEERTAFLTKLARQLRKQQGLEDNSPTSGSAIPVAPDLFQQSQSKGEWYFYNATLKTQGSAQFKQTWGNRPNVDNWRRFSDVNQQLQTKLANKTRDADRALPEIQELADNSPTITSLLNNLPLTEAKRRISDDSLRQALNELGIIFLNDLEDYSSAIEAFEALRARYPADDKLDAVLLNLYYAYTKSGDREKAAAIKKLMEKNFPASRYTSIVSTGQDPARASLNSKEATRAYENIYDLFLEGKFDEAQAAKTAADSIYKTSRWNPQLLYIQAVYQIRQRQDSIAGNTLQTLISQDPNAPLGKKALNLLQVLRRRAAIEDELNKLQISRPAEDSAATLVAPPLTPKKDTLVAVITPPVVKKDTLVTKPAVVEKTVSPTGKKDSVITVPKNQTVTKPVPKIQVDTTTKKPIVAAKPANVYRFDASEKHQVGIVLTKVDQVFLNEARNAFIRFSKEKYVNLELTSTMMELDADRKILLVGNFNSAQEALDYLLLARQLAPSEIVPWLKADKYSFTLLTTRNLSVLQEKKDLGEYQRFLEQNLPGKF